MENDSLIIGGREFKSRLFVGTGKFSSPDTMLEAVLASESEMITVAMKRVNLLNEATDDMLTHINRENVQLLPNTSGVRNADEAVLSAQMSREIFHTDFIKLEIHPDPKYLLPDPVETLKATERLAGLGFVVLPYIQADPVLCKRLEDAGASAVMPLGAPIGTNRGLLTKDFLEIIIEQSNLPVIIDAGLGVPSHAAAAMEMGADAVLVNTAIAIARNPVEMAVAFRLAVEAGRKARLAGPGSKSDSAVASSELTSFLNNL
ncbi:MAG: thiazole synthase [Muribaculaceae bacterium]|nr:thiazole synthase [Muribaculaceae bacterium]